MAFIANDSTLTNVNVLDTSRTQNLLVAGNANFEKDVTFDANIILEGDLSVDAIAANDIIVVNGITTDTINVNSAVVGTLNSDVHTIDSLDNEYTVSQVPINSFHGYWQALNKVGVDGVAVTTSAPSVDQGLIIYINTTVSPIVVQPKRGNWKTFYIGDPLADAADIAMEQLDTNTLVQQTIFSAAPSAFFNGLGLTMKLQADVNTIVCNLDYGVGTPYEIGTASQTGTTVTGVGTTFTNDMVGGHIRFNNGVFANITAFVNATTLTVLQSQIVTSQVYVLYSPPYVPDTDFYVNMIFRRIEYGGIPLLFPEDIPKPYPSFNELDGRSPDYNLPTNVAKYLFDFWIYGRSNTATSWNPTYQGFKNSQAVFAQYLGSTGKTYTSNIQKFRITANGSGMTDVYTDTFHYAPAGSTVAISGLGGGWAGVNGTYVNGVSVHAYGGDPVPSSSHLDSGVGGSYTGHLYLNLNSTGLPAYTANAGLPLNGNGVATSVHWTGPATLSVTHRIHDNMEYAEFIAALLALYFDLFKVRFHTNMRAYLPPPTGSKFLFNTWTSLQAALAPTTTALLSTLRTRSGRMLPVYKNISLITNARLYSNTAITAPFYSFYFNDPYGYLPTAVNNYGTYDITSRNYCTKVANLYVSLDGTPTLPYQKVLGNFTPNQSGTNTGGAYFVTTTSPYNYITPSAGNPDPTKWRLLGDQFGIAPSTNASLLHFGFVNSALTPGKKVGYVYIGNSSLSGAGMFNPYMTNVATNTAGSVRGASEVYMSIIKTVMIYLKTEHPDGAGLDALILDNRYNPGGQFHYLWWCQLIGNDRVGVSPVYNFWTDNGSRPPQTLAETGWSDVNGISQQLDSTYANFLPSETIARYGANAVFNSGKVILLQSFASGSTGDAWPNAFLSETVQTVKLFGNIDGRLCGTGLIAGITLPTQKYSNLLRNAAGSPVQMLFMDAEVCENNCFTVGATAHKISVQDAYNACDPCPTLTGRAGNAPLSTEFEDTIWQDVGLIPHLDAALPGWPYAAQPVSGTPATWRDRHFEQCIQEANL